MSDIIESYDAPNVYEEHLNNNTSLDLSSQCLEFVPEFTNGLLSVLYLNNNKIAVLPEDLFPALPNLKYLDLRDNILTDIPKSIKSHRSLTHLLLQNNKITSLPEEIGTVTSLKVIQLSGNPLIYPPSDIIKAGTLKIVSFLHDKFVENLFMDSPSMISDRESLNVEIFNPEARSYNSVLDQEKIKLYQNLSVQLSERENESDEESYSKNEGKCPKLPKSRSRTLTAYCQSSKYLKPLRICSKIVQDQKMTQNFFKDMAVKKKKDFIATRDKILQGRRNIELLKDWRKNYRHGQFILSSESGSYKLVPNYPYDTSPEYMALLTREDIEKDLPDKFRKKLVRRSKPTIPRRDNADVHLAMKIKQLFDNLEAIDLNRDTMTPRTEQKALLGEIHKISEIKQKLKELTSNNIHSVIID